MMGMESMATSAQCTGSGHQLPAAPAACKLQLPDWLVTLGLGPAQSRDALRYQDEPQHTRRSFAECKQCRLPQHSMGA